MQQTYTPTFSWLNSRATVDNESVIDTLTRRLHLCLTGELSSNWVVPAVIEVLNERPLDHERDKYKKLLALAVLACESDAKYAYSALCFRRLTGQRFRGATRALNHPAIREYAAEYNVPTFRRTRFEYLRDFLQLWLRKLADNALGPY